MKKKCLLLLILQLFLFYEFALSQCLIKGRVFDLTNLEGLSGANITFLDGKTGTSSNQQGYFEMPCASDIVISMLGYENLSVKIKDSSQFLHIGLKQSNFQLNEVMVSAYQSEKKLLSLPASVAILSSVNLHRDNDLLIAPALNRVSGVYMHAGTLTTNRLVIRGIGSRSLFSTNKVRAFLDDIPLSSGEGETSIEDIDLQSIDRVEIIKGPASSLYGAGLGGTILLRSQKADYQKSEIATESILGSYGLFRQVGKIRHSNEKSNLSGVFSSTHSNGYRENNTYQRNSFFGLGNFFVDEKQSLSFLANWIQVKARIPSSIDSLTFVNNPKAAATNWLNAQGYEAYNKLLMGFSHHYNFSKYWEWHTALFASLRNNDEPRPFNILRENNQIYGLRSYFEFSPTLSKGFFKWMAGGEYFREFYTWRTYQNNNREIGAVLSDQEEIRRFYNIFTQAELGLSDKIHFTAGLNTNINRYQLTDLFAADSINQSSAFQFKTLFSPRFGLSYLIQPKIAFFASVSHGFSPPSVDETLTPDGQINPAIQPETGWSFETGFRGSIWEDKLNFDVVAFTMPVRNLLVARRTAEDAFIGLNAGATSHKGIELNMQYHILKNEFIHLHSFINTTFAEYRFKDFIDGDNDYSGKQLTGVPSTTLNAGLDIDSKIGFYGNVNYQWIDKIPVRDNNAVFSKAYTLLRTKIGFKRIFLKNWQVNIYGGIDNLTDEKYAAMLQINAQGTNPRYYYPGLPRNFFGGISLSYQMNK